jgi:hypothetical protein
MKRRAVTLKFRQKTKPMHFFHEFINFHTLAECKHYARK